MGKGKPEKEEHIKRAPWCDWCGKERTSIMDMCVVHQMIGVSILCLCKTCHDRYFIRDEGKLKMRRNFTS